MSTVELERSLTAWLEDVESREAPSELLGRTFAVTRVARQRRPAFARVSVAMADVRILPRIDFSPAIAIALLVLLGLLMIGTLVVGSRLFTQHTGWQLLDRAPVDGGYTWVSEVTAGGPGLVALGNTVEPVQTECGREVRGRIWTSANGGGWADQSPAAFADVRMEKIVRAGGKVYALGTTGAACDDGGLPSYATWSSSDGVTWAALADSSALAGSFISSVIDVGGTPLAIGIYQEAEPPDGSGALETRIWATTDTGWALLATLDQVVVGRAAASGDIVLAVGSDLEGKSKLFRSDDGGRTWSTPTLELDEIGAVAAAGGRFLLAGGRFDDELQTVLASDDGLSWSDGESLPHRIVAIWSTGGRFIAAGMSPSGEVECAEWTSGPIATAYMSLEPGETAQAIPTQPEPTGSFCIRGREPGLETWVSDDGLAWRDSAPLPERGNGPPEITVPIPAASYSFAGTADAIVIANPTFGEMLWFSPFGEFVGPDVEE